MRILKVLIKTITLTAIFLAFGCSGGEKPDGTYLLELKESGGTAKIALTFSSDYTCALRVTHISGNRQSSEETIKGTWSIEDGIINCIMTDDKNNSVEHAKLKLIDGELVDQKDGWIFKKK